MKDRVQEAFGKAAATYEQHAEVQRWAADLLAGRLGGQGEKLPDGPVLELGCGTGVLSRRLVAYCRSRRLLLTDIAQPMLEVCRRRIEGMDPGPTAVEWRPLDAEKVQEQGRYALVVSGMTVHWFGDLAGGLGRLVRALKPGGRLLFSYQEAASYPEWRAWCRRLGLPFTAKPLPGRQEVQVVLDGLPVKWEGQVLPHVQSYEAARDFFTAFRSIGAQVTPDEKGLGAGQLRRLMRAWDGAGPVRSTVYCGFVDAWRRVD